MVSWYIDTNTQRIWRLPIRSPITDFRFERGSAEPIQIRFVTDGAVVELGSGATVTLGYKQTPTAAGYIIPSVTATKTGTGTSTVYTLLPTFLSTDLDTYLSTADSKPVYMQVKWVDGTTTAQTPLYIVRVSNNVNRGGETVPTSPSAFLSVSPSAAGSTDVSAAGGMAVVYITAGAGSGTYTYKFNLLTTGVPTGTLGDFYIQLPASVNPTIQVRNASSSGTILHTVSGDSDNATYEHIQFRFNGTAWVAFD